MKNVLYDIAHIIPDYITKEDGFYVGFSEDVLEKIVSEIFMREFDLKEIDPDYYFTAIYDDGNDTSACDIEINELRKELEKIEGSRPRRFCYILLTMIDAKTGNSLRFYFIPKLRIENRKYKLPEYVFHRRVFYYDERRGTFGILENDETMINVLEKYTNKEIVKYRIKSYISSIESYDKELYL